MYVYYPFLIGIILNSFSHITTTLMVMVCDNNDNYRSAHTLWNGTPEPSAIPSISNTYCGKQFLVSFKLSSQIRRPSWFSYNGKNSSRSGVYESTKSLIIAPKVFPYKQISWHIQDPILDIIMQLIFQVLFTGDFGYGPHAVVRTIKQSLSLCDIKPIANVYVPRNIR